MWEAKYRREKLRVTENQKIDWNFFEWGRLQKLLLGEMTCKSWGGENPTMTERWANLEKILKRKRNCCEKSLFRARRMNLIYETGNKSQFLQHSMWHLLQIVQRRAKSQKRNNLANRRNCILQSIANVVPISSVFNLVNSTTSSNKLDIVRIWTIIAFTHSTILTFLSYCFWSRCPLSVNIQKLHYRYFWHLWILWRFRRLSWYHRVPYTCNHFTLWFHDYSLTNQRSILNLILLHHFQLFIFSFPLFIFSTHSFPSQPDTNFYSPSHPLIPPTLNTNTISPIQTKINSPSLSHILFISP